MPNIKIIDTTIKPIMITRYSSCDPVTGHISIIDYAEYDYYPGVACMKMNNIRQITSIETMSVDGGYVVSCGKVMVRVGEDDYPEIKRFRGS